MTMRGVQIELPASATARHTELSLARDAALDALRSAQQRLNDLPDDADRLLRERLSSQVVLQTQRNSVLHRLLSSINQALFQMRLRPGEVLVPITLPVTLPKGQTAAEAIDAVRAEIAAIKQQELAVRRAPLKKQSREQAVVGALARLADRVRPKVSFDPHGNARMQWASEDFVTRDEVLGMIVWALGPLGPAQLVEAFELKQEAEPPGAILPEERETKLSELAASLLAAERRESALLDKADVLPRPDMSPEAYLQVEIRMALPAERVA
jgi:hypothetical protein